MQQVIELKYINSTLQNGLVNWREVYLFKPQVTRLIHEVNHGRLVYGAKGSAKRIGNAMIKKVWYKKISRIVEEVPYWLPV